jgi:hypothetical protein
MSRLERASARLIGDEVVRVSVKGASAGLNAGLNANRLKALLSVTPTAVVVARERIGTPRVERFEIADLLGVEEAERAHTGLAGALAEKNQSHPLGQIFAPPNRIRAIELRTRRGDLTFVFDKRQASLAREATLVIAEQIETSS